MNNINYMHYAGYMPSDLYNLNSSYGSVEELKHCIEELHSQDLLVCCAGNDIKNEYLKMYIKQLFSSDFTIISNFMA
jgi:hypothetical protein